MERGEQWLKELLQLSGFSVEIQTDKEESSLGKKTHFLLIAIG